MSVMSSFVRSTASVNCIKSFVPKLKKSTSFASLSTIITAAGTSIITPSFTTGNLWPSSSSCLRALAMHAFARLSSLMLEIIGSRIRKLPFVFASKSALSCVMKISSRARHTRIERHPMNGLDSFTAETPFTSLSPPASSVRITTGQGAIISRICR